MNVYYHRFHHLNIFNIKVSFSQFLYILKADDWIRSQEHTFHNRLRKLCLLVDNDTRLIYETVEF